MTLVAACSGRVNCGQRLDRLGGVAVANYDQLDRDAPLVFNLSGDQCQCGLERRLMQLVAIQPVAQLPLLTARQLLHCHRVISLTLDHRQSLQN